MNRQFGLTAVENEMHYEVRFTVRLPDGVSATAKEVEDWLRFYLNDNGSLDGSNPLIDHEPEPLRGTFRCYESAGFRAPNVRMPAGLTEAELCGGNG